MLIYKYVCMYIYSIGLRSSTYSFKRYNSSPYVSSMLTITSIFRLSRLDEFLWNV